MYKIRRQEDGLFSTGGQRPKFTKTGKVWRTLGQLKAHLHFGCYGTGYGFEVVELGYVEKGISPLFDLYQEVFRVQEQREQAKKVRWAEAERRRELRTLNELAAKHGIRLPKADTTLRVHGDGGVNFEVPKR